MHAVAMHQWTRKHGNPCASLRKTMNQSLQHGSFFINAGKTGKWRIEFHSAIFPVIIEKKAANSYIHAKPVIHAVLGSFREKPEGLKIFGD